MSSIRAQRSSITTGDWATKPVAGMCRTTMHLQPEVLEGVGQSGVEQGARGDVPRAVGDIAAAVEAALVEYLEDRDRAVLLVVAAADLVVAAVVEGEVREVPLEQLHVFDHRGLVDAEVFLVHGEERLRVPGRDVLHDVRAGGRGP